MSKILKHFSTHIMLFLVLVLVNICSITLIALGATPLKDYSWARNSISCEISSSISTKYGRNLYTGILSGVKTWNSTDAPRIITTTASSTGNKVLVNVADYGATGWNGNTGITSKNKEIQNAVIRLNTNYITYYLSDGNLWKSLSSHEMGHALGLGHNTSTIDSSIMKSKTENFYNYRGSSPKITVPTQVDKTAINNKY